LKSTLTFEFFFSVSMYSVASVCFWRCSRNWTICGRNCSRLDPGGRLAAASS